MKRYGNNTMKSLQIGVIIFTIFVIFSLIAYVIAEVTNESVNTKTSEASSLKIIGWGIDGPDDSYDPLNTLKQTSEPSL